MIASPIKITASAIASHAALAVIIGTACALTAQLMNLSGKRLLWVLPLLTVGYSLLLLLASYSKATWHMPADYLSTLMIMDIMSWVVAVFGASFVGYIAMKPRVSSRQVSGVIG